MGAQQTGAWPKRRQSQAEEAPFAASSALPQWLRGAEELVPIGLQREPIGAEKASISAKNQKNVGNPNHHYFSKKYRKTPPICIAVRLQFVLQYFWCPWALRKGKSCQYSSHLYRSTPPICIPIRLPFVSQYFWENLGGCGHRDVPQKRSDCPGGIWPDLV